MQTEKIKEFAVQKGFQDVALLGKWRGYDVYEPIYNKDSVSMIGLPLAVLVKDNEMRMTTPEEAMSCLDEMDIVD